MSGGHVLTIVWLRCVDRDTANECWVVCNQIDEGAVPFVSIASVATVEMERAMDEAYRANLIHEHRPWRRYHAMGMAFRAAMTAIKETRR